MLFKKTLITLSCSSFLLSTLSPSLVLAAGRNLNFPALNGLDAQKIERIQELVKRHRGNSERPQACPLESDQHKDILGKIQSIKDLFNDNCLDGDQNRLDDILAGASSIQDELNKLPQTLQSTADQADTSSTSTDDGQTTNDDIQVDLPAVPENIQVAGREVAKVLGGINDILKNQQCRSLLDNRTFLEKTAEVVQDFAKFGLLVPNQYALMVSGGGFALSSILLVLNSIFERRFNFEDTADRQTFIKLNCAFYDIRRDIEKSGFLDVATDDHFQDRAEVVALLDEVKGKADALAKEAQGVLESIQKDKESFLKEKLDVLAELDGTLKSLVEVVTVPVSSAPAAQTAKLQQIRSITVKRDVLLAQMAFYRDAGISEIPLLDDLLITILNKFDPILAREDYMGILQMAPKAYDDTLRADLLFHFERLSANIARSREALEKKWTESTTVNGVAVSDFLKEFPKTTAKVLEGVAKQKSNLEIIDTRLKRITEAQDYSSTNDGTENIVNILDDYDEIADKIYGKHGHAFLEYTTEKGRRENEGFLEKFEDFADSHLDIIETDKGTTYKVPNVAEVDELRVKFACQDARPYRRRWKFSLGLVEQGYDFVATNGDLFHDDIPRVFLGRSGNRHGLHRILSKYEKIQMHYKSAVFAKKVLNGEEVSESKRKKYLRKKFLGRAMLEVQSSKGKAQLLQELIEKYDCNAATALE